MTCVKPKCRHSICNKCSVQTEMNVSNIGQWAAVRSDLAWLCPQCSSQNQINASPSKISAPPTAPSSIPEKRPSEAISEEVEMDESDMLLESLEKQAREQPPLPSIVQDLIDASPFGKGSKPVVVDMMKAAAASLVGRSIVNGVFVGKVMSVGYLARYEMPLKVIGQRQHDGVEWFTIKYDDGDQEDVVKEKVSLCRMPQSL